jgi:hypothetical protein
MKELAYLVGQISPKFEVTYQWRKNVIDYFAEAKSGHQIDFINPCSNPFNKKVLQKAEYAVQKNKRSWGIDLLVPKDRSYVKRSTMAIVNMNQYDPKKPLLGSFFELAWYREHPEKAVIGFADDLESYMCQHPFVQKTVHTWCNDEYEACQLLEKYFVDVESL